MRVLAMDAVQKVGNGHPGTAMSLAPAAYLLFQKVMRHNPADPHWPGRDRFVLSCGHSSLTLYIQLFLGGWGLELDDLKALRTWGSKTPGHPEYGHTAGVETTTGPLGQGIGNAVGMAMAARRERGLLDPNAAEGASPFDHHIYALCSDGDIEEGVSAEASAIAGVQRLGNLTRDLRRQPDLDRGRHRHRPGRGRRRALRGLRLARADRRLDPRRHAATPRTCPPSTTRSARPRRSPTGPASSCCARSSPGRRRTCRTPARRHGSALGDDEVAATKKVLGFDPDQTFEVPPGVLEHTREAVARGKAAQAAWDDDFDHWSTKPSADVALFERMQTRTPARRLGRRAADVGAPSPKGVATRVASGKVINAIAGGAARAVGRLGRPRRLQQHHHRGRPVVPAQGPLDQDVPRRPVRRPGAALRHPRARHGLDHERHRRPRRHPRLRRHVPHVLRLHAPGGAAGRAHGAAGHLRVDPRLDRPRRGRPDPPADRAPRRAAGDPRPRRRPPRRRQRDRRRVEGDPRAHRPPRRPVPEPAERARSSRAAPTASPTPPTCTGAATSCSTHSTAAARRGADRHRLRGPARRRGARAAGRRRASGPASSRCRAASGSTSRRRRTARPSSRRS